MCVVEKELEKAFDYFVDGLIEEGVTIQRFCKLLQCDQLYYEKFCHYLAGWIASRGFGVDYEIGGWLQSKLGSLEVPVSDSNT